MRDMKAIINFYEESYQYNTKELADGFVTNLARLGSGMLTELNHQFNYRPTLKDLWAECVVTIDNKVVEQYRVIRVSPTQLKMRDVLEEMEEIKIPVILNEMLTFKA
jgi:hypothetical protein